MAHSAPPSRTRRRLELILAAVALSAGIALAVVAILALEHPKGRAADSQAAASTPSSASASGAGTATSKATGSTAVPSGTAATPTGTAEQLPVIVLNSTADASLTGTADARVRARGWTITRSGTFTGDILSTAVYYDPDAEGAQQAASRMKAQFPAIKRALPKFAGLPSGPIVLVLATDYS